MNGQNQQIYREWSGRQWAGEDPAPEGDFAPRWTPDEWVGDQGHGTRTPRWTIAQMTDGQRGLSGYGHAPRASHWAPSH